MQLHTLTPGTKRKHRKRIGRGGKRGTYSGRGQKGQRARAGHKIRPTAERELIARFPKLRGVKNKPKNDAPVVINIGALSRFARSGLLNRAILAEEGVIKNSRSPVKILGDGEAKSAFTIQGIPISKSAREKIEKAGGVISNSANDFQNNANKKQRA